MKYFIDQFLVKARNLIIFWIAAIIMLILSFIVPKLQDSYGWKIFIGMCLCFLIIGDLWISVSLFLKSFKVFQDPMMENKRVKGGIRTTRIILGLNALMFMGIAMWWIVYTKNTNNVLISTVISMALLLPFICNKVFFILVFLKLKKYSIEFKLGSFSFRKQPDVIEVDREIRMTESNS